MKKDIGLKVATKREALYIKVRDAAISRIESAEEHIDIDKEILKVAERIIAEENAL